MWTSDFAIVIIQIRLGVDLDALTSIDLAFPRPRPLSWLRSRAAENSCCLAIQSRIHWQCDELIARADESRSTSKMLTQSARRARAPFESAAARVRFPLAEHTRSNRTIPRTILGILTPSREHNRAREHVDTCRSSGPTGDIFSR